MKEKIIDIILNRFEDDIFGEQDLELIEEKVQENKPIMFGTKNYFKKFVDEEYRKFYKRYICI